MNERFEMCNDLFEPVTAVNANNEVIYFNQAFLTIFKLTPRKLKKISIIDLFSEIDKTLEEIIKNVRDEKTVHISEELTFKFNDSIYTIVCRAFWANEYVVLTFNDLSVEKTLFEKYKQQLEQLKDSHNQVVQADKLRVIGELTAGVSHEINNPLTVACGNTEILGFMLDNPDLNSVKTEISNCIENIDESHKRIQTIISNMKEFLHTKDEENKEYCSINELIAKSLTFVEKLYEERKVELVFNDNKRTIVGWVNKGKFEQVIINLLQNSLDAVSEGIKKPKVVISLEKSEDDNQIHLTVTDNGPGIENDSVERIFDTFYTTKEAGKGTGLGLSISKRIMEAHQGDLEYIQGDSGACFRVSLPVVEVSSFAGNNAFLGKIDASEGVRVLVVDNDVQVLNLCHKFFEDTKFQFIGSTSADDAIALMKKIDVDIIITDIKMPEIDGPKMISTIRKSNKNVKVFYLSSKENMETFNKDKDKLKLDGFIIKPFTKEEFLSPLEKVNVG